MSDGPWTIWIASYPKSGNTWVRALLTALENPQQELVLDKLGHEPIAGQRAHLEAHTGLVSSELRREEIEALRPLADAAFDALLEKVHFRKVHDALIGVEGAPIVPPTSTRGAVYIARDPRDVVVSLAHHFERDHAWAVASMAEPDDVTLDELSFSRHGQVAQRLQTWSEHVTGWLDHSLFPVLLVRYEDLQVDAAYELGRIAAFADLQVDADSLGHAARRASFEQLRESEVQHGFRERGGVAGRFFRRGVSGAWREELEPDLATQVVADHGQVMARLGYR